MATFTYTAYNPPLDDPDYPAKFDLFFPQLGTDITNISDDTDANSAYIAAIPTTGIKFNDGISLTLGTGDDTTLTHTGTNTDINHTGIGDLRLINTANIIAIGNAYVNLLDDISLNFGDAQDASILFDSLNTELDITSTNIHLTGITTITGTTNLSSSWTINGTSVTSTAAELNILDGVTSTAAELNILDGVTSTAAELNILDGVTSTATELNILDGVTVSTAKINDLATVTGIETLTNKTLASAAYSGTQTGFIGDITGQASTIVSQGALATLDSVAAAQIDADAVRQSELAVSGGVSYAGTINNNQTVNFTLHVMSFFPMIHTSTREIYLTGHQTDGGTGNSPRFGIYNLGTNGLTYDVDYYYVSV